MYATVNTLRERQQMSVHILNGYTVIPYKSFKFSGGEIQVKLAPANMEYSADKPVVFHATITSADDLMELALVVDAVKRFFNQPIKTQLYLPYMPYARQDRVCAKGEALSLRVAATFINSLEFDKVTVVDPHSDVTPALLNNCSVTDIVEIFATRMHHFAPIGNTVLVSPDAGAIKKVLKLAQFLKLRMIQAEKIRNPMDGEITGMKVHTDHLGLKPVLVVDDICDGGRTFTELAKELSHKTDGKLNLYVTHGIFSKGLEPLLEWYDKIYCPYVFPGVEQNEKLVRI